MQNNFDPLIIRGKSLIPVVQGGMGVGVSASKLSSAVARENGVGTIASVDLRHLHEDLLAESKIDSSEEKYTRLNCIALDREIKKAKADSEGKGMIAVNVMKAVKDHAAYVRQACESGADAIVMGAGLPLDLPEMAEGYHKDVAPFPYLVRITRYQHRFETLMKKRHLARCHRYRTPSPRSRPLGRCNR